MQELLLFFSEEPDRHVRFCRVPGLSRRELAFKALQRPKCC